MQNKQDSFLKSVFVIGTGTIINMIIGFFTTPIITRIVDPNEYGQLSMFTMYASLSTIVLCLGMDQSLVRFFYEKDSIEYKKKIIAICTYLPMVLSLVLSVVFYFLVREKIISLGFDKTVIILLIVYSIESVVYRFCSLTVRLNHNNKLYAKLQVLQKAIYVVLALILLKLFGINDLHALCFATVISITACLLVSFVSQREFLPDISHYYKINSTLFNSALKYGYPFVFSMGITYLFESLDRLALNYYKTSTEVGIYASAMTFISLFNIVQTAFNTVWIPTSTEHFSKDPNNRSFYRKAFDSISFIMVAIGILLILFKDIFALLLGSKYREAAFIMPFLIFHPIMYTVSETTVTGINFAKKSNAHLLIGALTCLANFTGNTLLVPLLGCKGAAISTGVSYILFFVLRTILAERYYKVGYRTGRFYIIIFCIIVFAAYNTFHKFGLVSIIMAVLCLSLLLFLYRNTVIELATYALEKMRRR